MKKDISRDISRVTIWIAFFCFLGLIFSSLFPTVYLSNPENFDSDLYFNLNMMFHSDIEEIQDIASSLNLINLIFWVIIIFAFIGYIGNTMDLSEKWPKPSKIIMLMGCLTVILSIAIIVLQVLVIQKINSYNDIYSSSIFEPIKYLYFPITFSALGLISSLLYAKLVIPYSKNYFNQNQDKKDKPIKKKKEKKKKIKKQASPKKEKKIEKVEKQTKQKSPVIQVDDDKRTEMETWLSGAIDEMESESISEDKTQEKPVEIKTDEEPPKKKTTDPFAGEEKKDFEGETEEIKTAESFEKALSSAISKKQDINKNKIETTEEVPKQDIEEKPKDDKIVIESTDDLYKIKEMEKTKENKIEDDLAEDETPKKDIVEKKKITVRCPQCKKIFSVEKEGDTIKIKCPHCGKEGVTK